MTGHSVTDRVDEGQLRMSIRLLCGLDAVMVHIQR